MFQDLCEIKDNGIKIKDNITSTNIKTNGDIINNTLGSIFLTIGLPIKTSCKKDHKLSAIVMGSAIYLLIKEYFKLDELFNMFGIIVLNDSTKHPTYVGFSYSWTILEMGSKLK